VKHVFAIVAACFFAAAPLVVAQTPLGAKSEASASPTKVTPTLLSVGEVRKVDKHSGKLTIRHGALSNLNMPAMTMVFRVKDPAMLDQVKEGDKIKFTADKINGSFPVIELAPSK